MERITSRKNPLLEHMRRLDGAAYRRERGEFLCDSPKLVEEALRHGAQVLTVAVSDGMEPPRGLASDVRCVTVPPDVMASISPVRTPQGMLAVCRTPGTVLPEKLTGRRYAVLDGVQDPGNVGTIWRTADAAGFGAVIFGKGTADGYSPKVQRAAMGSGFRLAQLTTDDLAQTLIELRGRGYRVIASLLDGEPFFERGDLGEKYVLVIGNEARGISDAVRAQADVRLKLPMYGGAESLNAAVAAGIMMYDLVRRDLA